MNFHPLDEWSVVKDTIKEVEGENKKLIIIIRI